MRKIFIFILSWGILFVALFSCSKTKTPQEYLREEKRAIERYLERNNIQVTAEYPQNRSFAENEYFRTNDGLYIHVVDSGNGKKVRPMIDDVSVRFDYFFDVKVFVGGDTTTYMLPYTYFPVSFRYGITSSYDGYYSCNGWAIPLNYVSEKAIIDLIIPSSLGSQSDNNAYIPRFYKNLQYTKFK
ncbi:MAG: DUF4827 domain-containing protein [Dysgonamonadaceae bacterium]|jgi:hypothetical protein|nr:DUF4827 domain-containing protein [Dysgonamonadaceae bacterium]